jgi:hypothetical protein
VTEAERETKHKRNFKSMLSRKEQQKKKNGDEIGKKKSFI